jgi:hypothetical protein
MFGKSNGKGRRFMADPFTGRSKNPRVRLFVGVIVLLGAVGLVAYHARWVRSVFQGPVPITLTTLEDLKDPETLTNPWVSFAFNEAIDTGFVMESTDLGQTAQRSKYLLIRVGNRWLLADVPVAFAGSQVVGYLDKWSSPLSKKVIDRFAGDSPTTIHCPTNSTRNTLTRESVLRSLALLPLYSWWASGSSDWRRPI